MTLEEVLEEAGGFGLHQKLLCLLLVFFTTGLYGLTQYTQMVMFLTPPHWCWDSSVSALQLQLELKSEDVKRFSLPQVGNGQFSECQRFDVDLAAAYINWTAAHRPDGQVNFSYPVKNCDQGWVYNHTNLFPTVSSERNWVCENDWKPYFIHTAFWVGNMLGAWLWGFLSDRFGRRPTLLASHIVYLIGGTATLFGPGFCIILAARTLVGISYVTVSHLPFVLVLEQCGVSYRVVPLLAVMISYTLFSMSAPWLALSLPTWWWLTLVTLAPAPFILLSCKLIPESPAWLVVKSRHMDALRSLQSIARRNRRELPDSRVEVTSQTTDNKHHSVLALFHTPSLRRHTVLLGLVWMATSMCYLNNRTKTSNLGTDVYTSYFYGALVEVPCWTVPFLLNKLGRRWPLVFCLSVAGLVGFGNIFIPSEHTRMCLALALLGRMTVTAAYYTTLLMCAEIYPTVVRGQGMAITETITGIAVFISPSVAYLGEYKRQLSYLILSCVALFGAALTLALPETANKILPQSLEDAERCGESHKFLSCVCFQSRITSSPSSEKIEGNGKFSMCSQTYNSL